jgi:hypothetical protein
MSAPVTLLLYDSRSGSTLIAALLNRYAGVRVSLESAYISRVLEFRGRMDSAAGVEAVLDHLEAEVQFRELGLDRDALRRRLSAFGPALGRAQVIRAVTDAYFEARAEGAEHWVIKHPPYAYLPEMHAIFPGVRFIHVIRDGRAVYNSKRKTRSIEGVWMARNPVKAALDWRRKVRWARAYCERLLEIRYEDVLGDADAELEKVLDFLGVSPPDRRVVRGQEAYSSGIGARQKELHLNVGRSPDRAIADRWREELPPVEERVFSAVARAELRRFGYVDVASWRGSLIGRMLTAASVVRFSASMVGGWLVQLRGRVRGGSRSPP